MTRIQEIVYAIPEDVFRDEVFRNLVHSKSFSRLRCLGPDFLSQEKKQKIPSKIEDYCKVTPKEDELEEYSYAFSKRTMEVFNY